MTEPVKGQPFLEEIALAEGGVNRSLESENETRQERFLKDLEMTETDTEERKLKSGSLRRFFRLKKSQESDTKSEDNRADENGSADEAGGGGNQDQSKKHRFRLGNLNRFSQGSPNDPELDLAGSESKVTLKSSFSTYWNSVFKKKKSKSAHDVVHHSEDMGDVSTGPTHLSESALRGDEELENTLVEAVHALNISEEGNGN